MNRALSAATLALATFTTTGARATSTPTVYENSQTYPLGGRAAGMGGAYTALACDEGALHYNPAALACAGDSRLELAANAYMLQNFDAPSSLGPGSDIGATSYHPLPAIAGFVRVISDGEPGTNVGALAFGLSISVPRSIFLAVDPPDPTKKDFFSITVRDDILAGDLGLGWQVMPELAIGLSLGGVMRSFQGNTSLLLVSTTPKQCASGAVECFDFVASESAAEQFALGARAKLAARWTPARSLSFGVVFTTPVIDVYGSSRENTSITLGINTPNAMGMDESVHLALPERVRGSSQLALPGKVTIGAALSLPQIVLSLDLSLGLPRRVRPAYEQTPILIQGTAPPTEPIEDQVINLELQPNLNAGVEVPITDSVVLDLGFFTDLSATSSEDLAADAADRVHMFGGTAGLGLLGRQARSWFAMSFEYGKGTTRVRSDELTFEQIVMGADETMESTYTRWSLVGIIGSSYSFIDDDELPQQPD